MHWPETRRHSGRRHCGGCTARLESRSQRSRIQCPADEYEFVHPRLAWLPWLSRAPVERHVDAMENEPPRLAFQVDNALDPQQVLALRLNKLIDPPREPRLVHPARFTNGYAPDIRVVLVGNIVQQLRFQLQRVAQIESADIQDMLQVDIALSGGSRSGPAD